MLSVVNITFSKLQAQCGQGDFDAEYAEFIMEHGDNSERTICDDDTLINALEDGYLFEEFVDHLWHTMFKAVAAVAADLKCPQCGGEADNGLDKCIPQGAYMCTKCCNKEDKCLL